MSALRPVLLLAGTPRVVQAIARCLDQHGIAVDIAYPEALSDTGFTSRAVRHVYRLPDFCPTAKWHQALGELLTKNDYDTLIPTTDEALVAVTSVYEDLRRTLYPGCPAPSIVNSVLDKRLTLQAADECGIRIPREYQFGSLEDLDRDRSGIRFPLLAKPASKVQEVNFALRYFQNSDQLRQAFVDDASFGNRHLLQEYCPGSGLGIEALIWEGKIHALYQHRRLKELPSTGGVSVLAELQTPDPQLADVAVRLLRRLEWQGAAMVEFRYDPVASTATLMEINGRYWGSLPLSINAGIEFPYYEWQLAHGQTPTVPASYRPGLRTLWRTGDLMRLSSLIMRWKSGSEGFGSLCREVGRLAIDFCSPTPDALWKWSDPWPAVREFRDRILKPVFRPATLLRLLPPALRRQCLTYRYYGLRDGLRHTYIASLYRLHLRKHDVRPLLANAGSIMFVCSGNIIRSPLAALLLRMYLSGRPTEVESAGLFAKPGSRADPAAVAAAQELGISLDDHRSSALSSEMVERSNIIFVMDHLNEAVLLSRFPRASGKTFLLGSCSTRSNGSAPREILDPFGRGLAETRKCYGEVRSCIETLTAWLRDQPV